MENRGEIVKKVVSPYDIQGVHKLPSHSQPLTIKEIK